MGKNAEKSSPDQPSEMGPVELPSRRLGPTDEDYLDAFLPDEDAEPLPELDDFWLEQD